MSREPERNKYIGHRYVPLIVGEWTNQESYEGLTVVTYQGASYTSKKHVPIGIDILNEDYWVVTGNYDAQVENYRSEVRRVQSDMDGVKTDVTELSDNFLQLEQDTNDNIQNIRTETDTKISASEERTDTKLTQIEQETDTKLDTIRTETDVKIDNTLDQAGQLVTALEDDVKIKAPYHNIKYDRFFNKTIHTDCYLTHIKTDTPAGKLKLNYEQITGENKTVIDKAREKNYSVAINAGMFGNNSNVLDYDTIVNGQKRYDTGSSQPRTYRYYLAIMENGELRSYPTSTSLDAMLVDGVKHATVGFVPLYENGQKQTSAMNSYDAFNERHPRQIIAQTQNGDYYVLTIGGRGVDGGKRGYNTIHDLGGATLAEAYDILMSKVSNVVFAYNLDGGGSTQTVVRGNMINPTYSGLAGNELRERPDLLYIEEFESVGQRDELIEALAYDISQIKDSLDFVKGVQYGTWTPLLGSTANYTEPSVEYKYNTGEYVRIGNVVIAHYHIEVTNKGTGTGIVRMRGLPGANSTYNFITSKIDVMDGFISGSVFNPYFEHRGAGTLQLKALRTDSDDYVGEKRTNEIVLGNYESLKDSFVMIGTHIFITDADPKQQ